MTLNSYVYARYMDASTQQAQVSVFINILAGKPLTYVFLVTDVLADLIPRITVCGVGGAGGNTVNNLIMRQFSGVEFLVANTDAQALSNSVSKKRVQLVCTFIW